MNWACRGVLLCGAWRHTLPCSWRRVQSKGKCPYNHGSKSAAAPHPPLPSDHPTVTPGAMAKTEDVSTGRCPVLHGPAKPETTASSGRCPVLHGTAVAFHLALWCYGGTAGILHATWGTWYPCAATQARLRSALLRQRTAPATSMCTTRRRLCKPQTPSRPTSQPATTRCLSGAPPSQARLGYVGVPAWCRHVSPSPHTSAAVRMCDRAGGVGTTLAGQDRVHGGGAGPGWRRRRADAGVYRVHARSGRWHVLPARSTMPHAWAAAVPS